MADKWKKPRNWKKGNWKPGSPGTPPRFGETAKDRIVVVLTAEQKRIITEAAQAAGKSQSEWVREIALAAAKEARHDDVSGAS